MDWPEDKDFRMLPERGAMNAEEVPVYYKLTENDKQRALLTDGSYSIVGKHWRWKAALWTPIWLVTGAIESGSSLFAKVKAIQLALDIAELENCLVTHG